ncbi:MAG: alpha/beta hydrolase [Xanthomonadales bacterium]|nr:alpha/beta hydrolase [Xanthomonadales bacterium]
MRVAFTAKSTRAKMLLVALLSLLLCACQASLFGLVNATSGDAGLHVNRGEVFDPAHHLAMDIYAPKDAQHLPVVVFLYGGSWQDGKRQWYRWMGETLARQGLVVAIPDYRKYPDVHMAGFMSDATLAVGWMHAHAGHYGGDPDTMFLMGHSAGAQIAALLATDGRWLARVGMQPSRLAGFIGVAGPYDFLPLTDPAFIGMFGATADAQAQSQPVNFVDGDEPPMLLLQGTSDHYVSLKNTRSMARHLRQQSEPVAVRLYSGIGHIRLLLSFSSPLRHSSSALHDTLTFIHAHAGQTGETP